MSEWGWQGRRSGAAFKGTEAGRMDVGGAGGGWRVSDVERLVGLPRRDIQRCCYEGQGGVGVVHPKDSTWGSRSYDAEDLERLFLVRRQREAGMSLPEVKRAFDAAEAGGWETWAGDQGARLREEAQRADELALQAEALRAAVEDGRGAGSAENDDRPSRLLDGVIEGVFLRGLVDLRSDARRAGDDQAVARIDAGLAWFSACGGERLAGLWQALRECRAQRLRPGEAAVVGAVTQALWAPDVDGAQADLSVEVLAALLDAPGMELALELRLGAGGFDYLQRALALTR